MNDHTWWEIPRDSRRVLSKGKHYQDCAQLEVENDARGVRLSARGARGAEFARIVIDQQTALKLAYWIILGVEGGTPDADV